MSKMSKLFDAIRRPGVNLLDPRDMSRRLLSDKLHSYTDASKPQPGQAAKPPGGAGAVKSGH